MAFTYRMKINALGGVHDGTTEEYNDGYVAAIDAATEIGEDADEMIRELMETIESILHPNMYWSLAKWADDAETLLRRIRARVA